MAYFTVTVWSFKHKVENPLKHMTGKRDERTAIFAANSPSDLCTSTIIWVESPSTRLFTRSLATKSLLRLTGASFLAPATCRYNGPARARIGQTAFSSPETWASEQH